MKGRSAVEGVRRPATLSMATPRLPAHPWQVIINLPAHIQLLSMSATVRNPEDLGGWISQVGPGWRRVGRGGRRVCIGWGFGPGSVIGVWGWGAGAGVACAPCCLAATPTALRGDACLRRRGAARRGTLDGPLSNQRGAGPPLPSALPSACPGLTSRSPGFPFPPAGPAGAQRVRHDPHQLPPRPADLALLPRSARRGVARRRRRPRGAAATAGCPPGASAGGGRRPQDEPRPAAARQAVWEGAGRPVG